MFFLNNTLLFAEKVLFLNLIFGWGLDFMEIIKEILYTQEFITLPAVATELNITIEIKREITDKTNA